MSVSQKQYDEVMANWHDCKEAHRSLEEQYEGVCRERDEFIASYEHEITGLQEQLEAYREFYAAWWEVEKGVIDFDLHPEAVTRLSEAHAAVIRLDSIPASGERVAAGLPSSTSETSGANQSPEDSSPAKERP